MNVKTKLRFKKFWDNGINIKTWRVLMFKEKVSIGNKLMIDLKIETFYL